MFRVSHPLFSSYRSSLELVFFFTSQILCQSFARQFARSLLSFRKEPSTLRFSTMPALYFAWLTLFLVVGGKGNAENEKNGREKLFQLLERSSSNPVVTISGGDFEVCFFFYFALLIDKPNKKNAEIHIERAETVLFVGNTHGHKNRKLSAMRCNRARNI